MIMVDLITGWHEDFCRSCGAPADMWADLNTPLGPVTISICEPCHVAERIPTLGQAENVRLALRHPERDDQLIGRYAQISPDPMASASAAS